MMTERELDALDRNLRGGCPGNDCHAERRQAADAIAALRAERDKNFDNWKSAEEDLDELRAQLGRATAAPTSEEADAVAVTLLADLEYVAGRETRQLAANLLRQQAREIARLSGAAAALDQAHGRLIVATQAIDRLNERAERAEQERDALLSAAKRAAALCDEESRGPRNVLVAAIDAHRE